MNNLKDSHRDSPTKTVIDRRLKAYLAVFAIIMMLAVIGCVAFLAYFAYLAPAEKLKQFNETFNPKPHPAETIDYRSDTELFRIKMDEAFLKSKIAMLSSDSIYLSINLKDSLLSIEIQGVAMERVKINRINKSGIFDGMDGVALYNQFSSPFKVDSMFATIVKDPYILKIAPKDTIEAMKNLSPPPDTVLTEPVIFSAFLDKGILLQIGQSENDTTNGAYKYLMKKRYERVLKFMKTAINFDVPEYQPYITIGIPAKDARAIYRALPKRAFIAIRLD